MSHIASLFGVASKENDVMTRPEHFKISKTGSGVNGIIKKISFWGSFYEAEVMVEDAKLCIRLLKNNFAVGQKVFVIINNY